MPFILDTNIVSRMRRIERTPAPFRQWAEAIDYDAVFLSAITLMEIENGIILQEHRNDPFAEILSSWRDQILTHFASRILPVTEKVAMRCSRLMSIRGIETPDALIAATAAENDLILVTHNVRHFTGLGIEILNPMPA